MSRAPVIASVLGLGVVLLLVAAPASATCVTECTCATSCDYTCVVGICPDCEQITCEEWGSCINSPGCTPGGTCPALACTTTINGSSGGDTISGSSAHECINGFGGVDLIAGGPGDDTVHAGDGHDMIDGGSGNDCLWGDAGIDSADGGPGTDFCDAEGEINCEL